MEAVSVVLVGLCVTTTLAGLVVDTTAGVDGELVNTTPDLTGVLLAIGFAVFVEGVTSGDG